MTQTAINYAKVLYELSIFREKVYQTEEIFKTVPAVAESLVNPVISRMKKDRIIERIFPKEVQNFLKVLIEYGSIGRVGEIFDAYRIYEKEQQQIVTALLLYVTEPSEEQKEQIRAFLSEKYKKERVELTLLKRPQLLGGFILQIGDDEYDWSLQGRFNRLKQQLTGRWET